MADLPSREVVIDKLRALRFSIQAREEIAAWAISVVDDRVDVVDANVWLILTRMGAVDLPGLDGEYLYVDEDFADWEKSII